jgi:hypothetical protein
MSDRWWPRPYDEGGGGDGTGGDGTGGDGTGGDGTGGDGTGGDGTGLGLDPGGLGGDDPGGNSMDGGTGLGLTNVIPGETTTSDEAAPIETAQEPLGSAAATYSGSLAEATDQAIQQGQDTPGVTSASPVGSADAGTGPSTPNAPPEVNPYTGQLKADSYTGKTNNDPFNPADVPPEGWRRDPVTGRIEVFGPLETVVGHRAPPPSDAPQYLPKPAATSGTDLQRVLEQSVIRRDEVVTGPPPARLMPDVGVTLARQTLGDLGSPKWRQWAMTGHRPFTAWDALGLGLAAPNTLLLVAATGVLGLPGGAVLGISGTAGGTAAAASSASVAVSAGTAAASSGVAAAASQITAAASRAVLAASVTVYQWGPRAWDFAHDILAAQIGGMSRFVSQQALNKAAGDIWEEILVTAYEKAGFTVVLKPSSIMTAAGRRFPDLAIYYKGMLVEYIEAKASPTAVYNIQQRLADIWIEQILGTSTSVVRRSPSGGIH